MMNDNKTCAICNADIGDKRLAILPDTKVCIDCAKRVNIPRVKGLMIWDHKTSPTCQVLSQDLFNNTKKYTGNLKYGRGSAIHQISRPTSSI